MTGNAIVLSWILALVLGAVGARIAGGDPTKGSLIALAFMASAAVIGMLGTNLIVMVLAGVVGAGLIAGLMKTPQQVTMNAVLGAVIGQGIGFAVVSSI